MSCWSSPRVFYLESRCSYFPCYIFIPEEKEQKNWWKHAIILKLSVQMWCTLNLLSAMAKSNVTGMDCKPQDSGVECITLLLEKRVKLGEKILSLIAISGTGLFISLFLPSFL